MFLVFNESILVDRRRLGVTVRRVSTRLSVGRRSFIVSSLSGAGGIETHNK